MGRQEKRSQEKRSQEKRSQERRRQENQSFASAGASGLSAHRLETPAIAGYRVGMSSSGVIGRKLGMVYRVEWDVPREMNSALQELRCKLGPER